MTTFLTLSKLGLLAMQYVGVPYVWGGEHPAQGFDCSGFCQRVLRDAGVSLTKDRTANQLYHYLKTLGVSSGVQTDAILFFGSHDEAITHMAIALNDELMIEAGGGDSTTRTIAHAKQRDARVRIKPINSRSDLIRAINIKY